MEVFLLTHPFTHLVKAPNARWMLDCCHVPGVELNWALSHAKAGDDGRSGHVVVLHKGHVWKLEPWQSGELLSLDAPQT